MGKPLKDISGQKFGRLTAVSPVRSNGETFWYCKCDCGKTAVVRMQNLRRGLTQSCGCARIKKYQSKTEKTEAEKKAAEERERRAEERERKQDLTGKRFGHLIVLSRLDGDSGTLWRCRCECGNEVTFSRRDLLKGNIRSCGCRKKKPLQLTGQRFGKLLVLGKNVEKSKAAGKSVWDCVCDCGTTVTVRGEILKNGYKKSCGCARRGRPKKAIDAKFMDYHGCRDCADRKKCNMEKCKYEGDFCDESNH